MLGEPGKPEFATNVLRVKNRAALDAHIAAAFKRHPRADLVARLKKGGIAFGELNDVARFSKHPQLRRVEIGTPNGPVAIPAPPPVIDGVRAPALGPVPSVGQHSAAIRAEFA